MSSELASDVVKLHQPQVIIYCAVILSIYLAYFAPLKEEGCSFDLFCCIICQGDSFTQVGVAVYLLYVYTLDGYDMAPQFAAHHDFGLLDVYTESCFSAFRIQILHHCLQLLCSVGQYEYVIRESQVGQMFSVHYNSLGLSVQIPEDTFHLCSEELWRAWITLPHTFQNLKDVGFASSR